MAGKATKTRFRAASTIPCVAPPHTRTENRQNRSHVSVERKQNSKTKGNQIRRAWPNTPTCDLCRKSACVCEKKGRKVYNHPEAGSFDGGGDGGGDDAAAAAAVLARVLAPF
eukprot:COSAG03_NODE_11089_length_611_cov_1.880859_2_plen_112_part_00